MGGRLAEGGSEGKKRRGGAGHPSITACAQSACTARARLATVRTVAAVAFDTLTFARTLRERAKLSPEQAEGLADAMAEALQGDRVTKADPRVELADTRSEIVRWVAGSIGFQTLAVIGAVVALARALH